MMDTLNELLEKTDDPRIRDSLKRAFAMGVDIGAMITQQAVADGSLAVKDGALRSGCPIRNNKGINSKCQLTKPTTPSSVMAF